MSLNHSEIYFQSSNQPQRIPTCGYEYIYLSLNHAPSNQVSVDRWVCAHTNFHGLDYFWSTLVLNYLSSP